jgi:hypothetical protein
LWLARKKSLSPGLKKKNQKLLGRKDVGKEFTKHRKINIAETMVSLWSGSMSPQQSEKQNAPLEVLSVGTYGQEKNLLRSLNRLYEKRKQWGYCMNGGRCWLHCTT